MLAKTIFNQSKIISENKIFNLQIFEQKDIYNIFLKKYIDYLF